MLLSSILLLVGLVLACWSTGRIANAASVPQINEGVCRKDDDDVIAGAAILIAISGYLLLAGLATPVHTGLAIGLLGILSIPFLAASLRQKSIKPIWRVKHPLLLSLFVACLVLFVALPPTFNGADDSSAYYVFIREIVHSGALGPQPFSERRLFTLGGHFPFAALADSIFGVAGAAIVDPGLGLALVATLLYKRAVARRTPVLVAGVVFLALAAQLLVESPVKNTVPCVLPLAFILALALHVIEPSPDTRRSVPEAVIIGALAGASLTFRIVLVPYIAVLAALYVWSAGEWRNRLTAAISVAAGMVTVVLPFALLLYASSGTLIFPLSGTGVHESNFLPQSFAFGSPVDRIVRAVIDLSSDFRLLAVLAVLAISASINSNTSQLTPAMWTGLGFVLATVAIAYSTGGLGLTRYTFPANTALLAALVLTTPWARIAAYIPSIPSRSNGLSRLAGAGLATGLLAAGLFAVSYHQRLMAYAASKIGNRYASMGQSESEASAFRHVESVIPDGAVVLSTLERTYLLRQGRFRILANDQPRGAGPAPFWPSEPGAANLAGYLKSANVDFILIQSGLKRPANCDFSTDATHWARKLNETNCRFVWDITDPALTPSIVYSDPHVTLIKTILE